MHSVTSPTQTPPQLPMVQPSLTEEEVPSESQRYNRSITSTKHAARTRLNPTTGVPSGRLVTSPMEIMKPQRKDNRAADLMTNYDRDL